MKKKQINKQKQSMVICIVIAFVIGIIWQLVGWKGTHTTKFSLSGALIIAGVAWFILLHFTVGVKKLYDYIIDRRFSLSIIMIVVTVFFEFFQTPFGAKEFLLSKTTMYGPIWNIRFYLMLLVTYEFFMAITKNSKYTSFIGAIVVTFSGHVQYMFNYTNAIILGEFGIVCLKKYIENVLLLHSNSNQKNIYKQRKNVWLVLMCISGMLYSITFESLLVSYGYVFLALIIWQITSNARELKEARELKKLVVVQIAILAVIYIVKRFVYTRIDGLLVYDRNVFGAFDYLYTMFLPFHEIECSYLLASFISLFPIPLFIALYCLYSDDKGVEFLMPVAVVCVLEAIIYMSADEGIMATIKSIALFNGVNRNVLLSAINYTNLLLIFYFITNFEDKFFSFRWTIRITIISSVFAFIMLRRPEEIASSFHLTILSIEFCLLLFTFLNFDDKRYKGLFLAALIGFTVIPCIFINPIVGGKHIVYDEEKSSINENIDPEDPDLVAESPEEYSEIPSESGEIVDEPANTR